jgi:hypothetical protein
MPITSASEAINLQQTAKAFDTAYGNPDAMKALARATAEFFKTIGVQLNGAEQKYVLQYLVAMSPSSDILSASHRPMIADLKSQSQIVAVQ